MRKLLIAILIFPLSALANCAQFFYGGEQPSVKIDQLLCHGHYAIGYSYDLNEPQYSAEYLKLGNNPPRDEGWHVDHLLPPNHRLDYDDYTGIGFDRGHLAPSADFHSKNAMRESYSMANILPETSDLNQIIWARIEDKARTIVPAYIITGAIWGQWQTINNHEGHRITVPHMVYKAITTNNNTCIYVSPNDNSKSYKLYSLRQFTEAFGFNPVPASKFTCNVSKFKLEN